MPGSGSRKLKCREDHINSKWNWTRVLVAVIGAIAVLGVVAGVLLSKAESSVDVPLEVSKAVLNLIGALIIAGVLSAVLAKVAADRAERDERYRSLVASLQGLKAAYERMQVARFYLQASPTARTLIGQLPTFMEAREKLHRVQRDRFVLGTPTEENIQLMLDYISALAEEYRDNAVEVTQAALAEDGLRDRIRDGQEGSVSEVAPLSSNTFIALAAFVREDGRDVSDIEDRYGGTTWRGQPYHQNYKVARDALQGLIDASAPQGWSRRAHHQ
jgi:hypothetical protein